DSTEPQRTPRRPQERTRSLLCDKRPRRPSIPRKVAHGREECRDNLPPPEFATPPLAHARPNVPACQWSDRSCLLPSHPTSATALLLPFPRLLRLCRP